MEDQYAILQTARLLQPDAVRLLVAAQADAQLAACALDEPWDNVDLRGLVQIAQHGRAGPGSAARRQPK